MTYRFARVGDNYILKSDPEEQTFRVSKIIKHGNFKPLGSGDDGDGRNDIALVRVFLQFWYSLVLLRSTVDRHSKNQEEF